MKTIKSKFCFRKKKEVIGIKKQEISKLRNYILDFSHCLLFLKSQDNGASCLLLVLLRLLLRLSKGFSTVSMVM